MNNFFKKTKEMFSFILKALKMKSIHFIITISFTITTILAMLLIGFIFYSKYSNAAVQNIQMSKSQIIDQLCVNVDYYQSSITSISNLLKSSINKAPTLPSTKIEGQMDEICDTRDDIVSISIFSDKGQLIQGSPFNKLKAGVNVSEQDWFKKSISNPQDISFSYPHVQNLFDGKYNWVISHARTISFYYNGILTQGILLIDVNFNSINKLCKKATIGKIGYIYIIDSDGNIIYHPQQNLIYAGLKHENNENISKYSYTNFFEGSGDSKHLVTIKPINYIGWKVVGIFHMNELVASKNEVMRYSVWILLLSIIFLAIIFIFISAKITKPIRQLEESMKKVEEGSFDVNVSIKGEDEVVHLANTFNMMVNKIKQLMNQIVLEQEALRKSELNALQAQINPHFLYNTLDSIVWMAENGKSDDVITMVTSLARLFRISISRGKNIISVGEEIEHAKNYLIIQKIRYKNKFQYEIHVSQEVLQYKTIKLILQPIIENAIYHGIEYMVDEGSIIISAAIAENKLLFEVIDNGLGMNKETVEALLTTDFKKKSAAGVGVKNVHQRIQLSFGTEYGINIESEPEEGTRVKIWLPLIKED